MNKSFIVILLLLSACYEIYPGLGQAAQKPEPIYQPPIIIEPAPVYVAPTATPTLQPTPDKACKKDCDSALQSCRAKSQPQFSICVDNARTAMKDCLQTGDDAYCRLEYSKVRTVCFNSLMAGCDILFNGCVQSC